MTEEAGREQIKGLLKQGISAAKAGNKETAQDLLLKVVNLDQENIVAWLWLANIVEDLEDQEIALENVLALDPNHSAAQKRLVWVQKQIEAQTPPVQGSPPLDKLYNAFDGYQVQAVADPSIAITQAEDKLADKYLCPYCAHKTAPDDKKCPNCKQKLRVKVYRRKKPSWVWKAAISLQVLTLIINISSFMIVAFILGSTPLEQIFVFVLGAIVIGTGLFIIIGLLKRWHFIFYLYLINAILSLGYAFALVLSSPDPYTFFCNGIVFFVVVGMFFLVLQLGEDLASDQVRRLNQLDKGATTAITLLERGRYYARKKMWGLAALHLRRAALRMPTQLDVQLDLLRVYLNLKWYKEARQTLEQAKSISPIDSDVIYFSQLLESLQLKE